jgi:hypothetical protein
MTRTSSFVASLLLLAPIAAFAQGTGICRIQRAIRPRVGGSGSPPRRAQRELPAGDVRHRLGRTLELGAGGAFLGVGVGVVWDYDTDIAGTDSTQGCRRAS